MPTRREQVRQTRPAHEARKQAVPSRDLLAGCAQQNHGVGGVKPGLRPEGEFALARAQFDFERAQRHVEREDAAADRLQRGRHLVEARLGEILIALIEKAHLRRLRRPGRVCWAKPRIVELEQMKLDFEAGEIIEAGDAEARQRLAQNLPRRKRHRLAVPEIDVAQQPAGTRAAVFRRPRQHAERRRVRHHDEIAAALHLCHAEAAARREHRIRGLVRDVLGEKRGRHANAASHQARGLRRHRGLAAQHAMLVGERKAHEVELVLLDRLLTAPARRVCSAVHRPWRSTKDLAVCGREGIKLRQSMRR